ncbi:hypothetical protein [Pseudomonas sp. NPDC012596]|uniref:hypothetical protein n=1 Tax=Pseudomonas sp. NPDC012596 TaxID=3364419 RepID=UPI003696C371
MKPQGNAPMLKRLGWPSLLFFVSWLASKLLDSYFDLSILSTIWSALSTAADLLGEEIPTPLWQLCALALFAVIFFCLNVRHSHQLVKVLLEIQELKNPSMLKLSDNAHRVVMTIAGFIENNQYPSSEEILRHLSISKLAVESALDEIYGTSLIHQCRDTAGYYFWDLTADGRSYVLHPENLRRA